MSQYIWQHRMVDYTYGELVAVQRASRHRRDTLARECSALEERILRGGHDGELIGLQKERAQADAEVIILDEAIRKQWDAIVNRGQPP